MAVISRLPSQPQVPARPKNVASAMLARPPRPDAPRGPPMDGLGMTGATANLHLAGGGGVGHMQR